jgi:hypothetical protein
MQPPLPGDQAAHLLVGTHQAGGRLHRHTAAHKGCTDTGLKAQQHRDQHRRPPIQTARPPLWSPLTSRSLKRTLDTTLWRTLPSGLRVYSRRSFSTGASSLPPAGSSRGSSRCRRSSGHVAPTHTCTHVCTHTAPRLLSAMESAQSMQRKLSQSESFNSQVWSCQVAAAAQSVEMTGIASIQACCNWHALSESPRQSRCLMHSGELTAHSDSVDERDG